MSLAAPPDTARNPAPRVLEVDDARSWNELVLGRPDYDLVHGWEWGEVQRGAGFTPHRYAVFDGSACLAAVSLLSRRLPGLPYSILYASRGPLLDWKDARAWDGVLSAIRHVASRQRAIFARVSPAIPYDDGEAQIALAQRGFRPVPDDWTTWNAARIVLTLSLDGSEEALVARFRKGIRRDLAAAQRRGAHVRPAKDRADLLAFHRLTVAAGREKGFPVRPLGRLETLWDAYVARGNGVLLLAEHDGVLLGGMLGLRFGRRAHLHRATILRASEGQRLHQGPLAYWEFIRWAKASGCDLIDWGGSGTGFPPSETDGGHGVYQFKSGFGSELRYWLPYHDLVFRPALYRLARLGETRLLPLAWRLRARLNH
jgi:lipid II:glycine glycyltransferase (peptidoglycan interpeptide bridge formation enzyme)